MDVLSGFDGQKIIITPGMIELGEKQDELNEELGRYAAGICDFIFLVGEKQTRSIKNGVLASGFEKERLVIFERVEDAINAAKALPCDKRNCILIENDLPDNF